MNTETAAFLEAIAELPALGELSPAPVRERRRELARLFDDGPPQIDSRDRLTAGVRVPYRDYRTTGSRSDATILYVHGGGWVAGDVDTHDGICRNLAKASGIPVLSIDYARPPEHPHPRAVDDVRAVMDAVPGPQILVGDSSGAHIAFEALEMREINRVAGLVLIQPATDPTLSSESWERYGEGYFLTARAMRWYWETYLGGQFASGLASRDLRTMPPTYLVTSDLDPSGDEGRELGIALRAQGVPTTAVVLKGFPHGCLTLPKAFPSLTEEIRRISFWIVEQFDNFSISNTQQKGTRSND